MHAFFKETVVNFGPASCTRFPLQICPKTCAIFFKLLIKHYSEMTAFPLNDGVFPSRVQSIQEAQRWLF